MEGDIDFVLHEEYSNWKIVHHQDILSKLKKSVQVVPLQVQIVPSNQCNHRCHFCAYRMKGFPSNEIFEEKDFLSYEKIYECLEDFAEIGVKALHITGGGEPLVHPNIYDIFVNTLDFKLDLALVTNGFKLTEDMCNLLGDSLWVRVSMDSVNKSIYSFIRNVSEDVFDKVVENIKLLVKHKRNNIVGIGYVIGKENYKDIYKAVKFFKELGVDNIRLSAVFTQMGYDYFFEFKDRAAELAKRAKEDFSDDSFTVFNLFDERVKDVFTGTQNYDYCPIKELLTYIGADYSVYTCCTLAYNKKGLIGSIKNQRFKELWGGYQKTKIFENHNPSINCSHPCMYKGKNDFINYCIKDNPKHINYI